MQIIPIASGSKKGNCYHVIDKEGRDPILLDCGLSLDKIIVGTGFKMSALSGCLLTHGHMDHAKGAQKLMGAGINLYTSRGTAEEAGLKGHRLKLVTSHDTFNVGGWSVIAFGARHDAAEPLGFLLSHGEEKLLYVTDSCYIPHRFKGLTHILAEANYSREALKASVRDGDVEPELERRIIETHMSIETLKEALAVNDLTKVELIMLIHLSDQNADAARFKEEIQKQTGKVVKIA